MLMYREASEHSRLKNLSWALSTRILWRRYRLLCLYRSNQWLGAQDVHHAFQVVREYVQTRLRADVFQGFHLKVDVPHPGFQYS